MLYWAHEVVDFRTLYWAHKVVDFRMLYWAHKVVDFRMLYWAHKVVDLLLQNVVLGSQGSRLVASEHCIGLTR